MIQREKLQAIIKLYQEIAKILTPSELKDLLKYIIEGRSYADIGRSNLSKLFVNTRKRKKKRKNNENNLGYTRISSILRKIKRIGRVNTFTICKEYLLDNPSMEEMRTPSFHIGWLCDRLQKINNGGYWGSTNNKKTYKSRSVCLIPEYLQDSFKDNRTKCMMCGIKCSRKKDNQGG